MIRAKESIRPEQVRFQNQHVLFVEGNEDSFDPPVLKELFDNEIRIEPLGPCFHVKSAAKALHAYHPSYYFLIDGDHHNDEFIQKCWEDFLKPHTHNLLVWKRREIENYFLDPEYLCKSKYCQVPKKELGLKVMEFSKARLFLDAANHVVIKIREKSKCNWIKKFSCPNDFSTKEEALEKLKAAREWEEHASNVHQQVSEHELEKRFDECLERMTGGQSDISLGTGKWLSMIQGKEILNRIIHSECFQVPAQNGSTLSGKEKLNAVIKDLIKKDESILPDDFKELKKLIHARLK